MRFNVRRTRITPNYYIETTVRPLIHWQVDPCFEFYLLTSEEHRVVLPANLAEALNLNFLSR